jgi:hypothetical protein
MSRNYQTAPVAPKHNTVINKDPYMFPQKADISQGKANPYGQKGK